MPRNLELDMAIICSCLTTYRPLIRKHVPWFLATLKTQKTTEAGGKSSNKVWVRLDYVADSQPRDDASDGHSSTRKVMDSMVSKA